MKWELKVHKIDDARYILYFGILHDRDNNPFQIISAKILTKDEYLFICKHI